MAFWKHLSAYHYWDLLQLCQLPRDAETVIEITSVAEEHGYPVRTWESSDSPFVSLDESWPDLSDTALLSSLESWLAPFLDKISRRDHLSRLDLDAALKALVPWDKQRTLDRLAPTHVDVPSGSRVPVDYANPAEPTLSVRLQELFGLLDTPRVGGGKVPLTLHLLSLARRPVQVTRDLASFWAKGCRAVKAELKGRYPRHYWPDDPLVAEPTARVRPRPR